MFNGENKMSKDINIGLKAGKKIAGLIIISIGLIMIYFTYMNLKAARLVGPFFIFVGVSLSITGVILFIKRTESWN